MLGWFLSARAEKQLQWSTKSSYAATRQASTGDRVVFRECRIAIRVPRAVAALETTNMRAANLMAGAHGLSTNDGIAERWSRSVRCVLEKAHRGRKAVVLAPCRRQVDRIPIVLSWGTTGEPRSCLTVLHDAKGIEPRKDKCSEGHRAHGWRYAARAFRCIYGGRSSDRRKLESVSVRK